MRGDYDDGKYNQAGIIVKPLYFGMFVNIITPGVLSIICYYLYNKDIVTDQLGELAVPVFYAFCGLALIEAGIALWMRSKRLAQPMIKAESSFEADIAVGVMNALRPPFLIIASISVYGFVYFGLTGKFTEALVIILFSFVVFQFVRPRLSSANKIIDKQEELVKAGKFLKV